LEQEGRLDSDQSGYGTNVVPLGMSRAELRDGFVRTMQELYEPAAYFQRFEDLYLAAGFRFGQARQCYWQKHRWKWLKAQAFELLRCMVLSWRVLHGVPEPRLRREYRRRLWRLLKVRRDLPTLFVFLIKCASHYHYYRMAQEISREETVTQNPFSMSSVQPGPLATGQSITVV